MSVRERPKDDNKSKEKQEKSEKISDSLLDKSNVASRQKSVEEKEEESVEIKQVDELEVLIQEFISNLPSWIKKPWMYVKPAHQGHLDSWYDSWKKIILSYSKTMVQHILSMYDLQRMHPFTNKENNKELTSEELQYIIERMIEEKLAKWIDDDKLRVRIYFKSDAEWADILHKFSIDEGYAAEIMTVFELQQLKEKWSKLPRGELVNVLDILVEKNQAEWVGDDKDAIKFLI